MPKETVTTLYLDACCLSRPFDDLTQDRVKLEAEAVLRILRHVELGEWEWVASEALAYEIRRNPDLHKRSRASRLLSAAKRFVAAAEKERERTRQLIALGFRALDALHLACAESGGAGVFLTTDDRLLRQAVRQAGQLKVRVENPLVWLGEVMQT